MSTTPPPSKEDQSGSGEPPPAKRRGNRLALRARSFKEDFLEIIAQMRSSGNHSARSASPSSSNNRAKATDYLDDEDDIELSKDLETNIRQAHFALSHFRDVVHKNKLEMLPGNGTVVLETVTAIHMLLKKYVLNEQSSTLVSAKNQVYQSLANLIKLCDDYLLVGEEVLTEENVSGAISQVENAIENLVSVTMDKILEQDSDKDEDDYEDEDEPTTSHALLKPEKKSLDFGQKSSRPNISLTPSEKEVLEKSSASVPEGRTQNPEIVLGDTPPPKPPHPDRVHLEPSYPPPLPPKKKQKAADSTAKSGADCLSLRSKSPEDLASLLNASAASLDSILSHSRDEDEEVAALMATPGDNNRADGAVTVPQPQGNERSPTFCWDNAYLAAPEKMKSVGSAAAVADTCAPDNAASKIVDRLSGSQAESGFCSMPSRRSSASSQQLSSTRSSQQSYSSQESHHTEKKLFSFDTSNRTKFQSLVSENNQKIVSASTSSEKLAYQKQLFFKKCAEISRSEACSSNDSPSKKSTRMPHSHGEVKAQECHLHSSSLSFKTSKYLSPSHESVKGRSDKPPALPEKTRGKGAKRGGHSFQPDVTSQAGPSAEGGRGSNVVPSQTQTAGVGKIFRHKQSSGLKFSKATVEESPGARAMQSEAAGGSASEGVTQQTFQTVERILVQSTSVQSLDGRPPPLPPKKKPIMAYMEIFGNASHANSSEYLRHSIHAYKALHSEWQQQQQNILSSTQSSSLNITSESSQSTPVRIVAGSSAKPSLPPALPPKKIKGRSTSTPPASSSAAADSGGAKRKQSTPAEKRIPALSADKSGPKPGPSTSTRAKVEMDVKTAVKGKETEKKTETKVITEEEIEKLAAALAAAMARVVVPASKAEAKPEAKSEPKPKIKPEMQLGIKENESSGINAEGEIPVLDKIDITEHLLFKRTEDGGPDIRGGHPDALIIHATKANKNDFFEEAFLTTYRTFLTPLELIQKLCYRCEKFNNNPDNQKHRASRESFALLVRVVGDLTFCDLEHVVLQTLMDFVQQLLYRGDLTMAKALRVSMLQKCEAKRIYFSHHGFFPSYRVTTKQSILLDFKAEHIAEQMTLLDAELFMKIEIPEVLTWAQEQKEERSPNLTKFTEHFNKMSYWARSRILEQNEAKDREKYVVKFIKIMKHLRKISNFNSYLALLSALDSAPVRRLEWQRHITEGLKEYCALIDSSSSFRAYRQALAETEPPCIPYIGLVLQDLTFVHIGNSNLLPDGSINFNKRWQQYDILHNMKRFKAGTYTYRKNEKIIAFFNGFDESFSEEAMWQISEKLKPRGGKK